MWDFLLYYFLVFSKAAPRELASHIVMTRYLLKIWLICHKHANETMFVEQNIWIVYVHSKQALVLMLIVNTLCFTFCLRSVGAASLQKQQKKFSDNLHPLGRIYVNLVFRSQFRVQSLELESKQKWLVLIYEGVQVSKSEFFSQTSVPIPKEWQLRMEEWSERIREVDRQIDTVAKVI